MALRNDGETVITYAEMVTHAKAVDQIEALIDGLPKLYNEVAREREYSELAGSDFDPCRERQREISHLIGRLKRAHRALEELRTHRHDWDSNDYCVYCGSDGRA